MRVTQPDGPAVPGLTKAETGRVLGVPPRTVRKYLAAGLLVEFPGASGTYIHPEQVAVLLAGGCDPDQHAGIRAGIMPSPHGQLWDMPSGWVP